MVHTFSIYTFEQGPAQHVQFVLIIRHVAKIISTLQELRLKLIRRFYMHVACAKKYYVDSNEGQIL